MEKTKQNKHRGYFTLAAAGLGHTSQGGRDGVTRGHRGKGGKEGNGSEQTETVQQRITACWENLEVTVVMFEQKVQKSEFLFTRLSWVLTY